MPSLEEINAQIAELTRQADEIKAQEKSNVIAELRQKIELYSITARDLRLDIPSQTYREPRRAGEGKEKPAPKYRNEKGETWSGGRGRKPQWVLDVNASGGDIEDYRIVD